MALSRRELLRTAGVVVVVVGGMPLSLLDVALGEGTASPIGSAAHLPLLPQKLVDPLSAYTMATFAEVVNTRFRAQGKRQEAKLTLVRVENLLPSNAVSPHQECFSLVFRDDRRGALPQATYEMEHPRLGTFDLFLVPAANDGGPRHHVAIVNRRLS